MTSKIKFPKNIIPSNLPVDSNGQPLRMCVIHQVSPNYSDGIISNFIIGGVSVCVGHLDKITSLLANREDFWINDAVDAILAEEMEE